MTELEKILPAHSKIGASSMYRWQACPGSVNLCKTVGESPSSKYADEGTLAHEIAAERLQTGKWRDDVDPEMKEHLEVYVNEIEKSTFKAAQKLERLIEHQFDLSKVHPGLFGTCDAVIYDSYASVLKVYDLKYGAGIPVEATKNVQLSYYGLGAALTAGFLADEIELIIVQPRCNHPKGAIRRWKTNLTELLTFGEQLKKAAVATEKPNAKLFPGSHCRFCPAAGVCPAIHEKALVRAKQEFSPLTEQIFMKQDLAETLEWLPTFEGWIKSVRDYAYAKAQKGEKIPGWKLVAKRATRKWRDENEVAQWLEHNFPMVSHDLFERSLKSPAQIEKVLHKNQHEKLAEHIVAISSGEVLVQESDSRKEVVQTAFTSIEQAEEIAGLLE